MSRTLTEEEILDIVHNIPLPESMDLRSNGQRDMIHRQQCDVLIPILRTIKIHPNGIEELKNKMRRHWNKSTVDPSMPVGILAAQAIAQPATQGKLKNFSQSGDIRSRSYDADRLIEVLKVVSSQRYRNMTLVFKDKYLKYSDVLTNYRHKITEITLRKLVVDFKTINRMNPDAMNSIPVDWWGNFCYIFNVDLNAYAPTFLRLYLDTVMMAKYKITMKMIYDALMKNENAEFINVVYSPYTRGIIDIFISPNAEISIKTTGNKKEKIRVEDENTFIENVLIPIIVQSKAPEIDIQVSGIKGIVDMLPVELPLHTLFVDSQYRGRGIYDVFVNKRLELRYGIPRQRLKEALMKVGARIVKIPQSELQYSEALPLYIRCQCDREPIATMTKLYSDMQFELDGVKYRDWNQQLYHDLTYVYGETEGNNLMDVLSVHGIDKEHTISNDLREVRDVLGIEAAQNLIAQEIMIVCETIGYVHPSHISLVSSTMTRNGKILPVNHQGTSSNLGIYSNLAFERAGQMIVESSKGANEWVASSSTMQGTGRINYIGTGSVDILMDHEVPELKPVEVAIPKIIKQTIDLTGIKRPLLKKPPVRSEPTLCQPTMERNVFYTMSTEDIPMPLLYPMHMANFDAIVLDIGLLTV